MKVLFPIQHCVLKFNPEFVYACATTPAEMDCIGLYCMGWEI